MAHRHTCVLALFSALTWVFIAGVANADNPRYLYVTLEATPPSPYTAFYPGGIRNDGRVYGTLCDAACTATALAFFENGHFTALATAPSGAFYGPVNNRGTVGVSFFDPVTGNVRAALFQRGQIENIPPQPNEAFAFVLSVNDQDAALIESDDAAGNRTYVLYSNRLATVLNFGPSVVYPAFLRFNGVGRWLNNSGAIAGSEGTNFYVDERGFRYSPRLGLAQVLNPFPGDSTETVAWGQGINNRGDVLGYSFTSSSPYHERIGVWDHNGDFQTYFVETISSSQLLFNNANQIVITLVQGSLTSYLVPNPGTRLDLASLAVNLPAGEDLKVIMDMNDQGDLIGESSSGHYFLLQRLSDNRHYDPPTVPKGRRPIPGVLLNFLAHTRASGHK